MTKTHTSNKCFDFVDIDHNKLQNNTMGPGKVETITGFCTEKRVKMTSMMRNNLLRSWQLHRWSKLSLCLWTLNVHCHIHKTLSLGLKSNQVKIRLNIIIPAILMNSHHPLRFSDYILYSSPISVICISQM